LKKIIIFGNEEFAEVAHFYFTKDSPYDVVAFTTHERFIKKKELFGLPVIPFEKIEEKYPPSEFSMFVAIGYSKVNKVRARVFDEAKSKGFNLVSYVNSKATKWEEVKMGENCFILEDVTIQPFVSFGDDVIVWSGNHIGHHTKIGNHCFITSHVVISGNVKIEDFCFLGVNSTIRDGIKIGKENVIGAGSVILHDTNDQEVFSPGETKKIPITSDKVKHL